MERGNIFVNQVSDKGLITKHISYSYYQNKQTNKKNNLILKWAKELNRCFSQNAILWRIDIVGTDSSGHSSSGKCESKPHEASPIRMAIILKTHKPTNVDKNAEKLESFYIVVVV